VPKNKVVTEQTSFVLYTNDDNTIMVGVIETIWLTQKQIAELFGVQVPPINKHLNNIFASEELQEDAVISILETTAAERERYGRRRR
jgi:hypothetical protein